MDELFDDIETMSTDEFLDIISSRLDELLGLPMEAAW
jgi:hypothetical protein